MVQILIDREALVLALTDAVHDVDRHRREGEPTTTPTSKS